MFGGGGAKSIACVGAWKALVEAGLTPSHLVGTSMGAVIAAAFASGATYDEVVIAGRSLSQRDGPSLSEALPGGALGNSFPSGHMVRTVVAYGLIAFVVRRLAPSRAARALAIPLATLVIVAMVFDRLYLDVHWESDVIGGLLLGAIGLLSATVWLDRPRKAEN